MKKILLPICLLALFGCTPDTRQISESPCVQLDSLVLDIQTLEDHIELQKPWADVDASMKKVIEGLALNQSIGAGECSFINHHQHPQLIRFEFVERLTDRVIREHYSPGIGYLLELQHIYHQDKEISEYVSEELALVALHAPDAYVTYLAQQPELADSVLNISRFEICDPDSLKSAFTGQENGKVVIQYLSEMEKDAKDS